MSTVKTLAARACIFAPKILPKAALQANSGGCWDIKNCAQAVAGRSSGGVGQMGYFWQLDGCIVRTMRPETADSLSCSNGVFQSAPSKYPPKFLMGRPKSFLEP